MEQIPELEDKNFRVKDTSNRTKTIDPNGVKVLENPKGDIREYLEGGHKGEQLFTQGSALRETENAHKKLPASWEVYRDIITKKYKGNYQDFLKGEKIVFCGGRDSDSKVFNNINIGFSLRCADDSYFWGTNFKPDIDFLSRHYGFSVRCIKE